MGIGAGVGEVLQLIDIHLFACVTACLAVLRGGTMNAIFAHLLVLGDMLAAELPALTEQYAHAQKHHRECHKTCCYQDFLHTKAYCLARKVTIFLRYVQMNERAPCFIRT